jgi:hypothetical protein
MSSSLETVSLGSKAAEWTQKIVQIGKWCGKQISTNFKNHLVPTIKSFWSGAMAFLLTGIGLGVTGMLTGFSLILFAQTQKEDVTAQIGLSLVGVALIAAGVFSIALVGPAAII